jgi:hypothetical protein
LEQNKPGSGLSKVQKRGDISPTRLPKRSEERFHEEKCWPGPCEDKGRWIHEKSAQEEALFIQRFHSNVS